MTRREYTNTRDLTFSRWIREKLADSSTGLLVSDLDFIIQNYKTKKIMLLEIKTRGSDIKNWQKSLFRNIHNWILNGITDDWKYVGFHLIQFENTCFNDGKCYLDYREISEDKLIKLLNI